MNVAQQLIKQLPSVKDNIVGFQNTQNGRNLTFKPVQPSKKIIQVLHVKNHCTNIGASNIVKRNVVYVFDSLQSTSLDLATKKQVCCLTRPNNGTMTIDFVSLVRQQILVTVGCMLWHMPWKLLLDMTLQVLCGTMTG